MPAADVITVAPAAGGQASGEDADPITTEVVRQGLIAVADQMKLALQRTAFSPIIYDMIDFACGLFDRDVKLLAQARTLPAFLGTLGFCVEAALQRLGGREQLEPGDVIWSTAGYDNGCHPQDAVIIVPAFLDDDLVGYAVIKAHQSDIAAIDVYPLNTTDVFQEGVIFPAVRLYRGGELQQDMYRTILANTRYPEALEGDMNAQITATRLGAASLSRLVEKHGREVFAASVERMFAHGEAIVRSRLQAIPDGRYVATCSMDDDGIGTDMVVYDVALEVHGSDVVVDFSEAPPVQQGPINCPLPAVVASSRIAVYALAGVDEPPNEGHFRPIATRVRRGSMFYPEPPAPIFVYGWASDMAVEGLQAAVADVMPESVAAGSGGDLCGVGWWGEYRDGTPWSIGPDHPVGQGATHDADGAHCLFILPLSGLQVTSIEVVELSAPLIVECYELAPDSAGAGRCRGGLGVDVDFRLLEDAYFNCIVERTKSPGWGLAGGHEARPNHCALEYPDGTTEPVAKVTRMLLAEGTRVLLRTGGGGGFGPPSERPVEKIMEDIREGVITPAEAHRHYPQLGAAREGMGAVRWRR